MPQPHPTHIDIPPPTASRAPEDLPEILDAGPIEIDPTAPIPTDPASPSVPSAARPPPSRGILKNPFRRPSNVVDGEITPATDADRVQWDEANIAATEVDKDALMKITEPKTPYVRYDAENDLFLGDVPNFDLAMGNRSNSPSTASTPSTPAQASERRPSITSTRSSSSSRSASFSLPTRDRPVRPGESSTSPRSTTPINSVPEGQSATDSGGGLGLSGTTGSGIDQDQGMIILGIPLGATSANTAANSGRGEVFSDSEDEMDEEAKRKHKEFKEKMKEHYAMEAKVALRRGSEIVDEEEEEEEDDEGNGDDDPSGAEGGMDIDRQETGQRQPNGFA